MTYCKLILWLSFPVLCVCHLPSPICCGNPKWSYLTVLCIQLLASICGQQLPFTESVLVTTLLAMFNMLKFKLNLLTLKLTLHFLELWKAWSWSKDCIPPCSVNIYLPYDHTSDLVECEPSVRVSGAAHLIGNWVFTGLRSEVNMVREKSVTFTTLFSPIRQLRAACKIIQDVAQLQQCTLQTVIHASSWNHTPNGYTQSICHKVLITVI